jgi:hypothetical protein
MQLFWDNYYLDAFMMDHEKCKYFLSTSGLKVANFCIAVFLEGIFNIWNRIQDNWPKHCCVQLFTVSSNIYTCSTFHCRHDVIVLCFALSIPLFFAWPLHVRAKALYYNSCHRPQSIVHSDSLSHNLNSEVNWRC